MVPPYFLGYNPLGHVCTCTCTTKLLLIGKCSAQISTINFNLPCKYFLLSKVLTSQDQEGRKKIFCNYFISEHFYPLTTHLTYTLPHNTLCIKRYIHRLSDLWGTTYYVSNKVLRLSCFVLWQFLFIHILSSILPK